MGNVGPTKVNLGGYIGIAIGFLGWVIGFAVVCLATGHANVLPRVLPVGVLVSLALGATAILVMELVLRAHGRGRFALLTLWGVLLSDAAILWLLINHWLAPIIEAEPGLAEALTRIGSFYKTGDALPVAMLAAGTALLLIAAVRVLRTAPADQPVNNPSSSSTTP